MCTFILPQGHDYWPFTCIYRCFKVAQKNKILITVYLLRNTTGKIPDWIPDRRKRYGEHGQVNHRIFCLLFSWQPQSMWKCTKSKIKTTALKQMANLKNFTTTSYIYFISLYKYHLSTYPHSHPSPTPFPQKKEETSPKLITAMLPSQSIHRHRKNNT